jgi:phage shock protein E
MSSKRTGRPASATASPRTRGGPAGRPGTPRRAPTGSSAIRRRVLLGSGLAIALIALVAGWALLSGRSGTGSSPAPAAVNGTVIQANGGHWTNITPDTLASLLPAKDFTLLNVKTPYIGEIDGTDVYIPYTDVAARAAELPPAKSARIVVYCRSGHESAVAAQTLLDLGYTNILNLDGGMDAWTASGRQLVQKSHG